MRTNGPEHASVVRAVLMSPSLLFGGLRADYTVGKPSVAYVGVDTAARSGFGPSMPRAAGTRR